VGFHSWTNNEDTVQGTEARRKAQPNDSGEAMNRSKPKTGGAVTSELQERVTAVAAESLDVAQELPAAFDQIEPD
jgi:hypothetical protein